MALNALTVVWPAVAWASGSPTILQAEGIIRSNLSCVRHSSRSSWSWAAGLHLQPTEGIGHPQQAINLIILDSYKKRGDVLGHVSLQFTNCKDSWGEPTYTQPLIVWAHALGRSFPPCLLFSTFNFQVLHYWDWVYIMRGALFSVVSNERICGNSTKPHHRMFRQDTGRNVFTIRVVKLEQAS